jgi:hypothetical protein
LDEAGGPTNPQGLFNPRIGEIVSLSAT